MVKISPKFFIIFKCQSKFSLYNMLFIVLCVCSFFGLTYSHIIQPLFLYINIQYIYTWPCVSFGFKFSRYMHFNTLGHVLYYHQAGAYRPSPTNHKNSIP